MNIIVVDDESLSLQDLAHTIRAVTPTARIHCFQSPMQALAFARTSTLDVAFLDIEMAGLNGLQLAKELKDLQPELRIIFITGYDKYALDAFALHASGYLLKPALPEHIRRELEFALQPAPKAPLGSRIRAQTFGGFEVFVDGRPLQFHRGKTKELLAYLIDRRGGGVTTREACTVLWEDAIYDTARKNYFQTLVADLRAALREAHAESLLVRRRNYLSIDPTQLDCDSYRFLAGDVQAVNSYRHDYLPGYSWAELTVGALDAKLFEDD